MSNRTALLDAAFRAVAICGLALVSALVAAGCATQMQDDINDLRDYAADTTIPLETRAATLVVILENEDENTHVRAAAAQMLGRMKAPRAVPALLRLLGDGDLARVCPSELLRMEAVIALGRFAAAPLYQRMLILLYERHQEPSEVVRRQFIQSFEHAVVGDSGSADVLLDLLRRSRNRTEDDSLIWRATLELRRIAERPDLDAWDFDDWEAELAAMRGRAAGAGSGGNGNPAGGNGDGGNG